ncbi:hypothetical protein Tco_1307885 [Tanacetum coccineum]
MEKSENRPSAEELLTRIQELEGLHAHIKQEIISKLMMPSANRSKPDHETHKLAIGKPPHDGLMDYLAMKLTETQCSNLIQHTNNAGQKKERRRKKDRKRETRVREAAEEREQRERSRESEKTEKRRQERKKEEFRNREKRKSRKKEKNSEKEQTDLERKTKLSTEETEQKKSEEKEAKRNQKRIRGKEREHELHRHLWFLHDEAYGNTPIRI